MEAVDDSDLSALLRAAWQARASLHADVSTDCYRIFHGYSEGLPGIEIERYGERVLVHNKGSIENWSDLAPDLADALQTIHPFSCIVAKTRKEAPAALVGTLDPRPQVELELGLRYEIELGAARSPGLYLDARPAREWIRANASDRRVLNLFSFAGSLGVAALAGGAKSVTHVDTQRRALERCQRNHRVNAQTIDSRDLVRCDVPKFLRMNKGKRRFGAIIVDPPPTGRGADGLTPAKLAPAIVQLVDDTAWVLCFFHHSEKSWDDLEAEIVGGSDGVLQPSHRMTSGIDFPEGDERRKLRLSVFAAN